MLCADFTRTVQKNHTNTCVIEDVCGFPLKYLKLIFFFSNIVACHLDGLRVSVKNRRCVMAEKVRFANK